MNRTSAFMAALTFMLLLLSHGLIGQSRNKPAKRPSIKYSKIKKAKITTEHTSFKAFICDIDSSYVSYYDTKKKTKYFMRNKCDGCKKIPTEKVLSLKYPKLSIWGHITNYTGILGSIAGTIAIIKASKEKDNGLSIFFATNLLSTSLGINIGNTATSINRADRRTITKQELNELSFEESRELIAYKSYQKFKYDQENYCYAYHNHIKQYPKRSKISLSFAMADGSVNIGFIVKVSNDKVYLTESLETLVDLRQTQSDTNLSFLIADIEMIKNLHPAEYDRKSKALSKS